MLFISMDLSVSPNIKFSYDIVKGSVEDRRRFAERLNEQIYEKIEPHIKNNELSVDVFEKSLKETIPEQKRIDIIPFESDEEDVEGCSDMIEADDGTLIGQTIEIPMKDGKISTENLDTVFHECRHVLDNLCNPKCSARVNKMTIDRSGGRAYNNLLDKVYHDVDDLSPKSKEKELKNTRKAINSFLKQRPERTHVDCLQDLRHCMETERNAFSDEVKVREKMYEKNIKFSDDEPYDDAPFFMFDEKIELIKDMTAEIIAKQRREHKLSLEG